MGSHEVVPKSPNDVTLSESYEAAMDVLSSLITNHKRMVGPTPRGGSKFQMMFNYLQVLDLVESIEGLNIIHVAGTKGKGSTCTFCESILRECGFRTGLFTSPHLIDVRERFRINGLDISEEKFLKHFWTCFNLFKENETEDLPMPRLFQFLTLLAFKIFLSEKVDVAIIEVGLGGTCDSTNVVKKPVVCGVASLGMDHTEILGDSLAKIASRKAGIFKPHIPAFTVPQQSEAMQVLEERAAELMIPLTLARPLDPGQLLGGKLGLDGDHQFINAGLAVALCQSWLRRTGNLKELFADESIGEEHLPKSFIRGLCSAVFPGRAQVVRDMPDEPGQGSSGKLIFYLDGAHSPESMEICAKWFANAVREGFNNSKNYGNEEDCRQHNIQNGINSLNGSTKNTRQVLLFNCMEVRDPHILLPKLINTCASMGVQFSKALFVPSMSSYNKVHSGASVPSSNVSKDLTWQFTIQRTWEELVHGKASTLDNNLKSEGTGNLPSYDFFKEDFQGEREYFASSAVVPSLPHAIEWLRNCTNENPSVELQVLVTGSLHLIGDVLRLLRR